MHDGNATLRESPGSEKNQSVVLESREQPSEGERTDRTTRRRGESAATREEGEMRTEHPSVRRQQPRAAKASVQHQLTERSVRRRLPQSEPLAMATSGNNMGGGEQQQQDETRVIAGGSDARPPGSQSIRSLEEQMAVMLQQINLLRQQLAEQATTQRAQSEIRSLPPSETLGEARSPLRPERPEHLMRPGTSACCGAERSRVSFQQEANAIPKFSGIDETMAARSWIECWPLGHVYRRVRL